MGTTSTNMSKSLLILALGLAAVAYAAPVQMINDQAFVDKINNKTGILWTAGFNTRFTDEPLSAMKSLTGVKADSWGMVQAIPRENSTITDSSIPDSFDSETNWPKCAKVIGDIRDQSMCGCRCFGPSVHLIRGQDCCASVSAGHLLLLQLRWLPRRTNLNPLGLHRQHWRRDWRPTTIHCLNCW